MHQIRFTKLLTAAGVVGVLGVTACDFDVINPGPVQDGNLNLSGAHQGMVNGALKALQNGLGLSYAGENIAHGLKPSGHTGVGGTLEEEEVALLTDERIGGDWNNLHRGRWIAEEAVRRFTGPDANIAEPGSYPPLAEAYMWAGLANRILGENVCTAIFDGGEAQPKSAYFERAIAHFTEAERVAKAAGMNDIATAAIGARAAAHIFLGNASAARADAAKVPFNFVFTTRHTGRDSGGENSYLYSTVMSLAFQSGSLWGTPAEPHFLTTGDSRVAWGYDNGSLEIPAGRQFAVRAQTHPQRGTWLALVPMFYPLQAIAPRSSARELRIFEPNVSEQRKLQMKLVTGREMALIQAEADLLDGNWQSAMGHINRVRTATPVYPANLATAMDLTLHPQEAADKLKANMPTYFTGTPGDFSAGGNMGPVTANSLAEAWAALKFERYLETHLQMRRFGDRWRWRENNTPGALHPLEYLPEQVATRYGVPTDPLNLCFPTPRSEKDANKNVPLTFVDWNAP